MLLSEGPLLSYDKALLNEESSLDAELVGTSTRWLKLRLLSGAEVPGSFQDQ